MNRPAPWFLGVLALGCLPAPTPAVAPSGAPSGEPEAVAEADAPATPSPLPERSSPPPPRVQEPRAQAEPPPLQSVVPIELGFPADAIVVGELADGWPITLFDDEKDAVRRAAATWLKRRRLDVVPVDRLLEAEAAAAQGRLLFEDDLQCRSRLSRVELRDRYFPRARYVAMEALCEDECRLIATIVDLTEPDSWVDFTSARVRAAHDPAAWTRATRALAPRSVGLIGTVFGIGMSSHPPPITFDAVGTIGPWAGSPTLEEAGVAVADSSRCAHPDPLVGLTWSLRAAVNRAGQVERCTATSASSRAEATAGQCLCDLLSSAKFASGRSGRRLRVEAHDTPRFLREIPELTPLQPGTEVWVRRLVDSRVTEVCESASTLPAGFEATLALRLAEDGALEQAEVFGPIADLVTIRWASCMVRELATVPLPCRPPGIDTLQVLARMPEP